MYLYIYLEARVDLPVTLSLVGSRAVRPVLIGINQPGNRVDRLGIIIIISIIIISIIIIITRPWPAFGRQGLVGSSFEYSYTRLASRLRRSARSGIITVTENEKCHEMGET